MATDYTVRLSAQDQLTPTLKSVKEAFNETSASSNNLDKIAEKFKKIEASQAPLKKKLKDIQMLMAQINLNGDPNSPIYTQMAAAAGLYKDAITDAAEATRRFASDTMNIDAAVAAIQGIAAAGSVATGVMGLLGVENENVAQAILKVQSAMAILNGVQQIANLLTKDSVLMMKIKQVQSRINLATTKASTVAEKANNAAKAVGNTQTVTSSAVTGVNTATKVANTVATGAATVAQNAWNVAAAIGKAIFGDFTGIALLAAAGIVTYSIATSDSTSKTEKQTAAVKTQTAAVKEQRDVMKEYSDAVGNNLGAMVASFKKLQYQWSLMATTAEKTQWIKDNANAFRQLGLAINGINDAENVFVKNSAQMLKSFEARAKAAAAEELYTEAYKDYLKSQMSFQNYFKAGDDPWELNIDGVTGYTAFLNWVERNNLNPDHPDELWRGITNKTHYTNGNNKYELTEWGAYLYNLFLKQIGAVGKKEKERLKQTEQLMRENFKESMEGMFGLDDLIDYGPTPTKEKYNENSLKYAQEQVQVYQELLDKADQTDKAKIAEYQNQLKYWTEEEKRRKDIVNSWNVQVDSYLAGLEKTKKELEDARAALNPNDANDIVKIEDINKQIKDVEEEIKKTKIKLGIDVELLPGSLTKLKAELEEAKQDLSLKFTIDSDPSEIQKQIDKIASLEAQVKALETKLGLTEAPAPKTLLEQYSDLESKGHEIQEMFDKGLIDKNTALAQIASINEEIDKLGGKRIKLTFETDLDKIVTGWDQFSGVANNIDSVVSAVDRLKSSLEEGSTAWEKFMAVVSLISGVMQTVTGVIDAYNVISGLFTAKKAAETAETTAGATAETAAAQMKVAASTEIVEANAAETIANKEAEASFLDLAAAQIFAANAYIPLAGVSIASGLIAQMMSVMSAQHASSLALAAFAEGGIVGGNSFIGDQTLIRVNSGEMILNKKQQANLFNLLDRGTAKGTGVTVSEVRLKGSDIYLALKNYNGKMNKIR